MEEANQHTNQAAPAQAPASAPAPQAAPVANPVADEKQRRLLFGVLSYVGLLIVIPYVMGRDIPGVKFHVKQGVVLLVIEIAAMIVGNMAPMLSPLIVFVNLACLVFSIIGILNVINHREKELPFIGQFAKHVPM